MLFGPDFKFITFTGPSGAGKTETQHGLVSRTPNVAVMTSNTDRPRRPSDKDGDYNFWSAGEMEEQHQSGDIAWVVEFGGYRYWASKSYILKALESDGYCSAILVPEAVPKLMKLCPGKVLPFWVMSPGEAELRRRLLARGDEPDQVDRIVSESINWLPDKDIPYQFLRNDRPLADTVEDLEDILKIVFHLNLEFR